ncbi:uncharacterized protein BDR25DRAFT_344698 [Lindgomyces ingoldianus]|uniref:Uncharacterized protein n=1 Tax=Lindgomyces ingoldianus TaxID=673940 RepID=A0ACB6QNZ2_9PLEO|nr:uncharacterized protein BDR25DRAFT_344698 [Lindgomyces ingoldianus]KAF2467997.1 hypothetical protein BDR25DRAFT_344698 [Lindgomyces ingoldianus]
MVPPSSPLCGNRQQTLANTNEVALEQPCLPCLSRAIAGRPHRVARVAAGVSLLLDDLVQQRHVSVDALVDRHAQRTEHDCYEPVLLVSGAFSMAGQSLLTRQCWYPRSSQSSRKGFSGDSGSMISISCFKVCSVDRPRTPPPSRASRRRSLSGMVGDMDRGQRKR